MNDEAKGTPLEAYDTDEQHEQTLVTDEGELEQEPEQDSEEVIKPARASIRQPRSWTYYAFALSIGLILVDVMTLMLGQALFWNVRTVYLTSFILRGFILLLATFFFHRRVFEDSRSLYLVTMCIGFVTSVVLACLRFIMNTTFWTFLNLIVEPVDGLLIALVCAYIIHQLSQRTKSLTSHNV